MAHYQSPRRNATSKASATPSSKPEILRPFGPTSTTPSTPAPGPSAESCPRTVPLHDASGSRRTPLQPKLTIGEPNDRYEQEADRVAAHVVQRINAGAVDHRLPSQALQRASQPEEEDLQMKPILQRLEVSEEEGLLQSKSIPSTGIVTGAASPDLEAEIQRARGGGQALAPDLQTRMGAAMGADFSGVRVHTDTQSDHLNRSIQAKAFTTGQDIFFRQGAYQPGSRGGQELIAHELTHVVQQNGLSVQRSPIHQTPDLGLTATSNTQPDTFRKITNPDIPRPIISANNTIAIQAAFEAAYVNDTAQLHTVDSTGKDSGTIRSGPKLKTGAEIEVDSSQSRGDWIKAKASGKEGYIRKTKVVIKSTLTGQLTDPELEKDYDSSQELADQFGAATDTMAGGLEQGFLKENSDGRLKDKLDYSSSISNAKIGLDIAAGTGDLVTGLIGMVGSAKEIGKDKTAWENLASGYGFLSSTAKATSGATKIVDSIAKASGSETGVGKSDVAGKITGAIADGLSSVKDAALGIIGIYRLFKSQSDEKGKDALVTFQAFTNAAASAAKVAKSAYDIIGNGIPMSIIYTVPALGIGVSAINLLIRLWDALKSGDMKDQMGGGAKTLRSEIVGKLGEPEPTEENVDSSKIFDKDRRGTFPNYKTYFRIKKPVREAIKATYGYANGELTNLTQTIQEIKNISQKAELRLDSLDQMGGKQRKDKQDRSVAKRARIAVIQAIDSSTLDDQSKDELKTLIGEPRTVAELQKSVQALNVKAPSREKELTERAKAKVMSNIDSLAVDTTVKDRLKGLLGNPDTVDTFKTQSVQPLNDIDQKVDTYELTDKMSEINQKRQTSGWTDVILELVSMAGDITTIAVGATGIGAAIGQGVKAASAGYKVVHGSAKFAQKLYRDRGDGASDKKSTKNKHGEYVEHAKFIYQQLASLEPTDIAKAKRLEALIRATGVNYGMWSSLRYNPQAQVEMLVAAMKKR